MRKSTTYHHKYHSNYDKGLSLMMLQLWCFFLFDWGLFVYFTKHQRKKKGKKKNELNFAVRTVI